jgi:hypothetical protein
LDCREAPRLRNVYPLGSHSLEVLAGSCHVGFVWSHQFVDNRLPEFQFERRKFLRFALPVDSASPFSKGFPRGRFAARCNLLIWFAAI